MHHSIVTVHVFIICPRILKLGELLKMLLSFAGSELLFSNVNVLLRICKYCIPSTLHRELTAGFFWRVGKSEVQTSKSQKEWMLLQNVSSWFLCIKTMKITGRTKWKGRKLDESQKRVLVKTQQKRVLLNPPSSTDRSCTVLWGWPRHSWRMWRLKFANMPQTLAESTNIPRSSAM